MPAQPTAPNSELTPESVNLLKAGDVLRHSDGRTGFYQSGTVGITVRSVYNGLWVFWPIEDQVTFIGRPDADGWIPHDGGPNPVPGCVVDVCWNHGETWTDTPPEPALKWENITHFRLAAPSVEREEPSKEDIDKFKSWFQPIAPKPDVAGAREAQTMDDRIGTHSPDCWALGPRHYDCATRRVAELEAKLATAVGALEAINAHRIGRDPPNVWTGSDLCRGIATKALAFIQGRTS